jgi:hypothetical protein
MTLVVVAMSGSGHYSLKHGDQFLSALPPIADIGVTCTHVLKVFNLGQ